MRRRVTTSSATSAGAISAGSAGAAEQSAQPLSATPRDQRLETDDVALEHLEVLALLRGELAGALVQQQ